MVTRIWIQLSLDLDPPQNALDLGVGICNLLILCQNMFKKSHYFWNILFQKVDGQKKGHVRL